MDLRCVITSFLAFADCEPGYVSVHMVRTTGSYASEERTYIIPGDSTITQLAVYTHVGGSSPTSEDVCLRPNYKYTLYLYDSYVICCFVYSLVTVMDGPLALISLSHTMMWISSTMKLAPMAKPTLSLL